MNGIRLSSALFISILLFFSACVTAPLDQLLNNRIVVPMDKSMDIPVFYATNRLAGSGSVACSSKYFTVKATDKLVFGNCRVNVPRNHPIGALDTTDPASANLDTHFQVKGHSVLDQAGFTNAVKAGTGTEILLFVHGFNVPFREAVYRAAQIAYDSKFQGTVVLMTWPAGSGSSFLDKFRMGKTYEDNQANARRTIPLAVEFLKAMQASGKKINLMVHSMGHQVMLPALNQFAQKENSKILKEIILNAPDFSYDEFKKISGNLLKISERITLYCSPGDNALKASVQVNKNHRAGLCGLVAGVDVINVNEVDSPVLGIAGLGHGYYSGRAIMVDIFQVLLGIKIQKRLFIRQANSGSGENYVLRK